MEKVLEIQKKAFLEEGPPSLEKRKDLLRRCAALIETHEQKIIKALNHDFQNRSTEEIKISEIDQTISEKSILDFFFKTSFIYEAYPDHRMNYFSIFN